MQVVALIPMKGNSERVPNKNIRKFGGNPLFYAICESLKSCEMVKKVVIDTDSEVIANKAKELLGDFVHILNRPSEICGDFVSMNEIIKYDISNFEDEHFIQTHSTNPLVSTETFDHAIKKYFEVIEGKYDSLFSVTRHQARMFFEDGRPVNHNPNELRRTQDLAPLYEENSNFYIFSKQSFEKASNKRIGINPYLYEVNKLESVDIDEHDDFVLAELLYKKLKK